MIKTEKFAKVEIAVLENLIVGSLPGPKLPTETQNFTCAFERISDMVCLMSVIHSGFQSDHITLPIADELAQDRRRSAFSSRYQR